MTNRSLSGPADAIEKAKNGVDELGENAESTFTRITDSAQRALDDKMGPALQFANDTYDSVGEAFRASEDYVRREPVKAVAIAAALGAVIGFCFAVRAAPISTGRVLPRW
jgi:ElaB/YqjD/DUF883 family membrane-anchored ribosome-binding protein